MSTVPQDTTSTTSNSNSAVSSKPSGGSTTAIAVGVSVGVVVLIILGVLAYFYGFRRDRKNPADAEGNRRETIMGPGHMASRVTPYYPFRGEGPNFAHTPGEGMRVAHRRADGGWEFSDSLTLHPSVTPFNLSDAGSSACPSPTTSVFTTISTTKREKKIPGELTTRGYVDPEILEPAPPAYTRSPSAPFTFRTSMGDF